MLFQLSIDPIRHAVKIEQCAKKIIYILKLKTLSRKKQRSSAPALWKLLLLSGLRGNADILPLSFKIVDDLLKKSSNKQKDTVITSLLQKGITSKIKRLLTKEAQKGMKSEFVIGLYPVDIAFPSSKLIVEIDGRKNHHGNVGQRNRDSMKDILLKKYDGWDVIRIPSYEYSQAKSKKRTNEYLQCKLKKYSNLLKVDDSEIDSSISSTLKNFKPKQFLFFGKQPSKSGEKKMLRQQIMEQRTNRLVCDESQTTLYEARDMEFGM